MVEVADLPESIRQTLYDEWNLHGSLSKTALGKNGFNTGVRASSRIYPSVEVLEVVTTPEVYTLEWWLKNAMAQVHVWVRPRLDSDRALGAAKTTAKYMCQEVERILHKCQLQHEDIDVAWITGELNADQYHGVEAEIRRRRGEPESTEPEQQGLFPILHRYYMLRVLRWHSATNGGIAVHR